MALPLVLILVYWKLCSAVVLSVEELAQNQSNISVSDSATCIGPWFTAMTNGTCHCGAAVNGAVMCNKETQQVKVAVCYCMTPDSLNNKMVVGTCFYTCESGSPYYYEQAPTKCSNLNRKGTLCGNCDNENHAFPRAYSYDMDCMKCPHPDSWWLYVAEAFIPLTAFVVIVIVCRVSVVCPKLRVFVFFSQLLSMPINARSSILYIKYYHSSVDTPIRIFMAIFGVWNLDFFRTLYPGVCLHLSELQVLALDYLVAVYPMILMIVGYALVELHGYGFRPLLLIWRHFHAVFVRFRREWNIETTIIDAFATFFILSTTKFFSVSFDLLIPTVLHLASGESPHHEIRLYYNANIVYMGHQHLPYAILAFAAFGLFVLLPFFLLMMSSFSLFHSCLRNCNHERRALGEFVHSFQQYYKDGTNGSPDRRWYAALYLIVFSAIYLSYAFMQDGLIYNLTAIFSILFAIVTLLAEPYRQEYSIYNSLDCVLFLWIALFCISLITVRTATEHDAGFVKPAVLFVAFVSVMPFVYVVAIFTHWVWKSQNCGKCQCMEGDREESLPHRIACSFEYRE